MQAGACAFGSVKGGLKDRFLLEGTRFNGPVDAEQILVDDPAGADVHVADFAVAHLSIRKPDVFAVSPECGFGMLTQQFIHKGGVSGGDGVARIVVADAPSVQDDEGAFV